MTLDERRRAVEALPAWVPPEENPLSAGDRHSTPFVAMQSTLRAHFARSGRRVYVSGNLSVYFPGERRVVPDLFAVMDCDPGPRDTWVVTQECRRPEFAIEILVHGSRWKDLKHHVIEYARLGIREYFILDCLRHRLLGYHLVDPGVAIYQAMVPQAGRYPSRVLGLELALEDGHVRFYVGNARLLEPDEVVEQLADSLNDAQMLHKEAEERAVTAEERAVTAEERATEETNRRAAIEAELERLRAEIALLRRA